jgi:N-acetylmuramoyl-L-alanine amidase
MRVLTVLAITATILGGQTARTLPRSVTAIRHWALPDATRVAIEVSGDFEFQTDRLHNPERIYFDILSSRPNFDGRRVLRLNYDDKLVFGVRVAETTPGITRVVLDLTGPVEVTTSQLSNPNRLIIELRRSAQAPAPTPTAPAPAASATLPPPSAPPVGAAARQDPVEAPVQGAAKPAPRVENPPAPDPPASGPSNMVAAATNAAIAAAAAPTGPKPDTTKPAATKPDSKPETSPAETSKAARHTSAGNTSLVRALGLKIGRVVIDAGHGGHDQGTTGPRGLLEKDVVLDVSMRVGKLIEDRMGAEVIYTRTDDTFVPLEGRTALANDRKADLFLSIHANSSSTARVDGVETYYLSLPDAHDKESADVAARENASSQKSVFELQDLVKKITMSEKVEESREFAGRVQTSLAAFNLRNIPTSRNRGVKKAPFVVLIGAHMPSILAEIGFLTNPREETLLRKPDYRQKLAEALFRGLQRYADGLSHFQVANAGKNGE